eukprot:9000941-Pyramimonas_sp.AAC.1
MCFCSTHAHVHASDIGPLQHPSTNVLPDYYVHGGPTSTIPSAKHTGDMQGNLPLDPYFSTGAQQ